MLINRYRRQGAAILSLLWLLTSCTTMLPLDNIEGENILQKVSVGDKVIITTKDGKTIKTRVESITKETITGEDVSVATSDISEIKIRQLDDQKAIGVTILVVVAAIIAVSSIISVLEEMLLLAW